MPLFGHRKILHTLVGMDSAALVAAAMPYHGKTTPTGQRSNIYIILFYDFYFILLHRHRNSSLFIFYFLET